jgi:hypothetical protein
MAKVIPNRKPIGKEELWLLVSSSRNCRSSFAVHL